MRIFELVAEKTDLMTFLTVLSSLQRRFGAERQPRRWRSARAGQVAHREQRANLRIVSDVELLEIKAVAAPDDQLLGRFECRVEVKQRGEQWILSHRVAPSISP